MLCGLCTPTVGLPPLPPQLDSSVPTPASSCCEVPAAGCPLVRGSDGRPQVKGCVLRVRRSRRAPAQVQDESFICFYLVFQAWIVGVAAGGRGSQEGTPES